MNRIASIAIGVAAAFALATSAGAATVTYNLSGDFSDSANPSGTWSYTQGSGLLAHFAAPNDGNSFNAAATNGSYGVGQNFTRGPIVVKTTANGSSVQDYNDGAFLLGDVVVHSTNPGEGDPLFINWIAPTAGVINFSSMIWYAHTPVSRSNDVAVFLGSGQLGSTLVLTNGITRPNAYTGFSGMDLAVDAGQMLSFRFTPTAGQQFGSLAGINATVDFTSNVTSAAPEPGAWALMIVGFGAAGAMVRRRRTALAA